MKFTIISLLIGVCCSVTSQTNLVGIRHYTYNDQGLISEKNSYDAYGHLEQFVHYQYDLHGQKIGTLKYSDDSLLMVRYIYINDEHGQRIASQKIDYKKGCSSTKTMTYNEEGLLDTTYYYTEEQLVKCAVCSWTTQGLLQQRHYFSPSDTVGDVSRYAYRMEQGVVLEKKRYDANDSLQSTLHYGYDAAGNKCTISSVYTSARRGDKYREYQFDAQGQCFKSLVYEVEK